MKNWNRTSLLTGVLAGITAALLSMGANTQSSLAIVLYAASALPILIAGLGWGNAAAIAAIVVAGGAAVALVSPHFALLIVVVTLVPAGWRVVGDEAADERSRPPLWGLVPRCPDGHLRPA